MTTRGDLTVVNVNVKIRITFIGESVTLADETEVFLYITERVNEMAPESVYH